MAKSNLIGKSDALREAGKKLPILPAKHLAANLDSAGASPAEAYRMGAAEAQSEIVRRLSALAPALEG